MKFFFEEESHNLGGIFADQQSSLATSLKMLGRPLAVYNLQKLLSIFGNADSATFPSSAHDTIALIERNFPSLRIDESGSESSANSKDILRMRLNSIVNGFSRESLAIEPIVQVWDVLKAMNRILSEITSRDISKNASIASSVVITGPCVIEDGVSIEDFCKIKGPIYIGRDTRVGDGNLLRSSMINAECKIGFGNEIARSYLSDSDTIPHVNIILDTVMGPRVWTGAYVGTTNVMLNNRTVRVEVNRSLVDTQLTNFGAIIDHDSVIGAGTIILPGRHIPSGCIVPPATVFHSVEKNGLSLVKNPTLTNK